MLQRIMIVDDEAIIAHDIEAMLRDAGYDVTIVAADAESALSQFDRAGADFAVLDADLGGQSAQPVADRLRAAKVPFIVVSGYTRQQIDWMKGELSLMKPFVEEHLVAAVRAAIPGRIAPA